MKLKALIFTVLFGIILACCSDLSTINSLDNDKHEVVHLYHQNGKMAAESFILNGKKDSLHQEWFPNGNLQVERMYKHGEIIAEKLFTIEGEIIKNIVIKDGRKYGLLFSSFCMNGVAKSPQSDSLIFKTKNQ